MIVKIFHEYLSQSRTNIKEDLQKLEDKINAYIIIAFVHHTAISEDTGEVKLDDIPKVMVEKK